MTDNERWDVYDNRGEKIGEIHPESNGRKIDNLLGILVVIACLVVVVPWIYIINAAVQGDDVMRIIAGLSLVSAIITGEKIQKMKRFKRYGERCFVTILGAGTGAGIVMALLMYLSGKPGMSGIIMIPVMMIIGILPGAIVSLLLNPESTEKK